MQRIDINYNPYTMKTEMMVNNQNVLDVKSYSKFAKFIRNSTPLQNWIEPLLDQNWNGLVNELCAPNCSDKLHIAFHGRPVDYADLKSACELQREKRNEQDQGKVEIKYEADLSMDDTQLAKDIDSIMQDLLSERFRNLVQQRSNNKDLCNAYDRLEDSYKHACDQEFRIVFAGMYSSGKSTIINALTHHDILPILNSTCTSKIFRIKHDKNIGDKLSLQYYSAEGNLLSASPEIFSSDSACNARIKQIVPQNSDSTNPPNVAVLEIGMNLSHLYPSKAYEDKFILTLMDTPGVNSSQTKVSEKEGNLHRNLTLEAITSKNKDMVILCASNDNSEDENIGIFLKDIYGEAQKDAGQFNDRFLFVLNKCDKTSYHPGESALTNKSKFATYLQDPRRWGLYDENIHISFVPKIFMLAAAPALSIRLGAHEFSREECRQDENKQTLKVFYKGMYDHVVEYQNNNYLLAGLCDTPMYQREAFTKAYEQALKDGYEAKAVEIQCGVLSLEAAIRSYIERYAYPLKVKSLIPVFSDILGDVESFTDSTKRALDEKIDTLGKSVGKREEAKSKNEEAEKRRRIVSKLKSRAEVIKKEISTEEFTPNRFNAVSKMFDQSVENDSAVYKIRHSRDKRYEYSEAYSILDKAVAAHDRAWKEAQREFKRVSNDYDNLLNNMLSKVKGIYSEAKLNGVLIREGYSPQIGFTLSPDEPWDIDQLRAKLNETRTPVKQKVEFSFRHFFRWMKSIFSPTQIDYYDFSHLSGSLIEIQIRFNKYCEDAKKAYVEDFSEIKDYIRNAVDELMATINHLNEDIENRNQTIEALGTNIDNLARARDALRADSDWLKTLHGKIKGVQ